MRRRTEHLVEKRDGRREFLRATKLARSVHLALFDIGVDEDWRALDLAGVVLEGLREKCRDGANQGLVVLTTSDIADAVQHLLVVTGQPAAAVAYGAVQAERARRRVAVGQLAVAQKLSDAPLANHALGDSPKADSPNDSVEVSRLNSPPSKVGDQKAGDRFGGHWPGVG